VADGGKLAVVLLQPQGRWAVARTVWNAATGQLGRDSAVTSVACTELTVEPASWRPPQVKLAFDGEREWTAPPLHFRVSDRPLWLVAPSALIRDDGPAASVASEPALAATQPAPEAGSTGGLVPA
jgi:diacylglycerol kinase family enzyme